MKNIFEDSIKNKVEQFDEKPPEKVWEDISQKINTPPVETTPKNGAWKLWAALVIGVILLGTAIWKISNPKEESLRVHDTLPVAEKSFQGDAPVTQVASAGDGETALEMFPIEFGQARQNEKALMVYVCMEGCKPCARFVNETLSQPDVIKYLDDNFHQVAVNMLAKENLPFLENYDTKVSPSVLFFNTDGELLEQTKGAIPTADFMEAANSAKKKGT